MINQVRPQLSPPTHNWMTQRKLRSHSIMQQGIHVTRAIYSVGSSSDASRIWRPARQRKSGNYQQLQRPHMQSKMSLTRKILRSHSEPEAEMFCRGLAQILLGCSGTGWTAHVSCWGGCSSGGRAVAHQSEGRWFDSGFPGLYVEASLGKTLNPKLPTDVSSVYECVYEWLEKHVVLYTLKTCCMSVCEWGECGM